MFEDVKQPPGAGGSPQPQPAGSQPMPGQDSSRAEEQKTEAPATPQPAVVEDVFADTDSQDEGAVQRPRAASSPPVLETPPSAQPPTRTNQQAPTPSTSPPVAQPLEQPGFNGSAASSMPPQPWQEARNKPGGNKRGLMIGIGIVVVALVGIGGYVAYQQFFAGQSLFDADVVTQTDEQNQEPEQTDEQNQEPLDTLDPLDGQQPGEADANVPALPRDSDGDGLTDQEEQEYGTDPLLADTDRDGLFDREEVVTWKTDPLNPDSDSDSYTDGDEVKNGYDPLGPGTLEFYEYISF